MATQVFDDGTRIVPIEENNLVPVMGQNFNQYGVDMATLGPFQRFITDPGLVGDKKIERERLGNIASFIPFLSGKVAEARQDKLGEALGYLDALPGVKIASAFLIAKRNDLIRTLKEIETDPILKGDKQVTNSLQRQLNEVNKELASEDQVTKRAGIISSTVLDEGGNLKDVNLTPRFTKPIYHGGPAGITTLRTPNFVYGDINNLNQSTGGIYSVLNKTDPRLPLYGVTDDLGLEIGVPEILRDLPKKSVYAIQPSFKNVADAKNLPDSVIDDMYELVDKLSRTAEKSGNPYDTALLQRTFGTTDQLINVPEMGAPSLVNKPIADIFRDKGFDAIQFPPRQFTRMGKEGDTILSLDDDALKYMQEISLEDLLKVSD
tara:strand:+ start:238 stop:1368 length:1131 start_codon:yes stop_codon:yes gene_type:complete